jgi:hypothetical protein
MSSLHTHNRGRAVEAGFQLPHNTAWTMADAWGLSEAQCRKVTAGAEKPQPYPRPKAVRVPPPTVWTVDKIDKLKALWAAGASCSRIARALGSDFTKNSVAGKVRRMDLPMRKFQSPRRVA